MYCTINVTFQCPGDAEAALPRLQALLDEVAGLIHAKHGGIESPQLGERIERDDVNEHEAQ